LPKLIRLSASSETQVVPGESRVYNKTKKKILKEIGYKPKVDLKNHSKEISLNISKIEYKI
jgi:hypothetical protein